MKQTKTQRVTASSLSGQVLPPPYGPHADSSAPLVESPEEPAVQAIRAAPLISILVVTYNREVCLESCLAQLTRQVTDLPDGLIEIIVSDNQSTDETQAVIERYASRYTFLRRVAPQTHYPSAEENLFFGVLQCRGDYIWPYGDDDFIAPGGVARIVELARQGEYGFYLINPSYVSTDGTLLAERLVRMTRPSIVLNMVELVQAAGLITVVASFTSTLIRRADLMAVDHAKYLQISPIYAHIAIYLAAFANQPCLMLNEQWITLRAGTGVSAFQVLAHKTKGATYMPWTNGLGRLLRQLETEGLIPPDLIFNTLECDGEGPFWTWANVMFTYTDQILLAVEQNRREDVVTPALFHEFRSFFAQSSQIVVEMFVRLEKLIRLLGILKHEVAATGRRGGKVTVGALFALMPDDTRTRLREITRTRLLADLWEIRTILTSKIRLRDIEGLPRIGRHGNYDLIRVGIWYYAVNRHASPSVLVSLQPGQIDPVQNYPVWLAARSLEALKQDLAAHALVDVSNRTREPGALGQTEAPDQRSLRIVSRNSASARSAETQTVDPDPITLDLAACTPERLAKYFDEAFYLEQYQEVARNVESGQIHSALDDFFRFGARDNRNPCLFINSEWYTAKYLAGVSHPPTPFPFAYLHYLMIGQRARHSPSPLFDESWYLSCYQDVRAAVLRGEWESGFDHFYTKGRFEGFDPHDAFGSAWYLQTYPAVANVLQQRPGLCAYSHFLRFGQAQKLQPHPSFSEDTYLRLNGDVRQAIEHRTVGSGWFHWLQYGKIEGRARAA